MVVVITIYTSHVQCDAGGLCETRQCMWYHLGTQLADFLPLQPEVDHAIRPAGDVDDGPREGFIERCVATAKPDEGEASAKGVGKGGAKGKEGVLCGVVIVDWWVDIS